MREYKLKKCKRVHGLHFTPDGARLLAAGGAEVGMVDSAVWLDLATGENVARADQFANCYAVPPDASRFVLGGANIYDGLASVQWTDASRPGEWSRFVWPKRSLPPSYPRVNGLAFDPAGARLAVMYAPSTRGRGDPPRLGWKLLIVDRDTGEPLAELPNRLDACVMRFSADGSRLAATGGLEGDPDVTVFDVATRREVFTFKPPGTVTRCPTFLPDNRVLVANARNVYVLPPGGGEPQLALTGHPKQVNAVAVTPDGRRVLTAANDGSIRTWDANTAAPGAAFNWNIGAVTALAFAPDGLTCAAAGLNGKVVVWDVDG